MKEITEKYVRDWLKRWMMKTHQKKLQLPSFNFLPEKEFVEFLAALKKDSRKAQHKKRISFDSLNETIHVRTFYVFCCRCFFFCRN